MDLLSFVRAALALVVTLGLVGLAAYAGRRWGPTGLFATRRAADRRLRVIETLSLDPQRRLVLVSCDGQERLLLLGEGSTVAVRPVGSGSDA